MWTKGILMRYAQTLQDKEREKLISEIVKIKWCEGGTLCDASDAELAFERAGLEKKYCDMVKRSVEFTESEDLDSLYNI